MVKKYTEIECLCQLNFEDDGWKRRCAEKTIVCRLLKSAQIQGAHPSQGSDK